MRIISSISSTWAGIALLLAGGCATNATDGASTAERPASETVCLSDHEITSFSPLEDDFLYVKGIGDRHYLLTMQRGCFGLRSANTIGIPDTVGRICSNSYDRVIYRDIATGLESCRILDIEAVPSREVARSIAEQREEIRREKN